MGAWNASINGNDTAEDLKNEYRAVFCYNDVPTALAKIDAYIRQRFDETDEEEWCNYYYSLADFMWRHGILTDEVKNNVISMIDSEYGMHVWELEGMTTLKQRKKVLQQFREKLLFQQPPKKKIKLNLRMKCVFETGDLVAIQLQTIDKNYFKRSVYSEDEYRKAEGKFVVLRKVRDEINVYSAIEPSVRDVWAVFQLYKKVFDQCPTAEQLQGIPFVSTRENDNTFIAESSMVYYKRRNCVVIGKNCDNIELNSKAKDVSFLFFSVDTQWTNPDAKMLDAIIGDAVLH